MTERFQHLAERIQAIDAVPPDDAITPVFAGIRKIGNRPVAPDPVKIALWSLLGGGVLALVAPFFAERLGHGQSKLARLESTLQLPGLGVIPARADLLPPFFEAGEIFHEMRAKLPADKAPRVLMVASAMPGEGKTTVAVNLAMSFAESGARTLVIDTDIRRGRLNRIFGFRKAPGLSNVLLGETPLEDAVRPTFIENLSVMNAGTPASAAPDLLASDAFATLMTALRESYDIIVLDTPPVLGLAETSVLQKHVDGVLLVVADNRTPKNSIQAAIEILRERGANMVGFVVNRVKPADQSV